MKDFARGDFFRQGGKYEGMAKGERNGIPGTYAAVKTGWCDAGDKLPEPYMPDKLIQKRDTP